MLEVLLRYVEAGAAAIRLDAVAFLWKQEGTSSINLHQTHAVVRLLRSWLDEVAPGLLLVTETNVPHADNVRYLGGRHREAQAVYQFALPPLVLHTVTTGDPAALVAWAHEAAAAAPGRTFLNFLSSHDGVGLRPVEGLLGAHQIDALTELCERSGGIVNRRSLPDGTTAPYELGGTWYGLMTAVDPDPGAALARHVVTHALALALRGIPLVYVHGLLASDHDRAGFDRTGVARQLNRADFAPVDDLLAELADPTSRRARSMQAILAMLRWRAASPAFHPEAAQRVEQLGPSLVLVERGAGTEHARVYVNVGTWPVEIPAGPGRWERFDGRALDPGGDVVVPALGSVWLRCRNPTLQL
jgi:glucosylglycerate phosphorylase